MLIQKKNMAVLKVSYNDNLFKKARQKEEKLQEVEDAIPIINGKFLQQTYTAIKCQPDSSRNINYYIILRLKTLRIWQYYKSYKVHIKSVQNHTSPWHFHSILSVHKCLKEGKIKSTLDQPIAYWFLFLAYSSQEIQDQ